VGIANMYLAIFADVGVMILAVLNAIRCLFVEKLLLVPCRDGGNEFLDGLR